MRIAALLLVLISAAGAEDLVSLNDGAFIRGQVTAFSNGNFYVWVDSVPAIIGISDVDSVVFDTRKTDDRDLRPAFSVSPPAPQPKPQVTQGPSVKVGSVPEVRASLSEFRAKKMDLIGKVIKLEFFYRSEIESIGTGKYRARLSDGSDSIEIRFDQTAYDYLNNVKTGSYRWSNDGLAKRGYYIYGLAELDNSHYEGVEFKPLGRTKKGSDYCW